MKSIYITYMGLTEPLLRSQALSYLKALSRKGIKVCILSFEKKQFLRKGDVAELKKELGRFGIKWFFLKYHKKPQFLSKPYDIIKGMLRVLYINLCERIDVIHARGTFCALMGVIPCLFLNKKMIFDMRGLMAEEYVDAGLWKKASLQYKLISRLERYFVRKADEVIILSNEAKKILADNRSRNITIIPTCVDLEKFTLTEKTDDTLRSKYSLGGKTVLMYVGSIGTWYMISEMLNFYQELAKSIDNTIFFILSQAEKSYVEGYIPDTLRDRVIIDSAKAGDVPRFLNLADIGIFFIKPSFSKTASCPTKFAEYLACGLPVVINKGIGDTEGIVKENRAGIVVEVFNHEEYRRKIIQFKELLQEGEVLKKRCRGVAEKYFSLEEGAGKYFQVYSGLTR